MIVLWKQKKRDGWLYGFVESSHWDTSSLIQGMVFYLLVVSYVPSDYLFETHLINILILSGSLYQPLFVLFFSFSSELNVYDGSL